MCSYDHVVFTSPKAAFQTRCTRHPLGSKLSRHYSKELEYAVQSVQEAKRFAAVNAETLVTHFAALEALVAEYRLDANHVWNLDETDVSMGRERLCALLRPLRLSILSSGVVYGL